MKKNIFSLCCIIQVLLLTSCESFEFLTGLNFYGKGGAAINREVIRYKDYGSPAEKVLLFGSINFRKSPVRFMEFAQINSENKPKFVEPNIIGFDFYFPPSDENDKFTLLKISAADGNTSYLGSFGIQQGQKPVFAAGRPGLQYIGSYNLVYQQNAFFFRENTDIDELDILKRLIKKFKDTEWEKEIKDRIEVLEESNDT